MNRINKITIWFAFLSIILAACQPTATPFPSTKPAEAAKTAATAVPQEITLTIWDQFSSGSESVDKIYKNFNAKNPNIKIKREIYSTDQLNTVARTALASGTGPDIVYLDVTPARELIDAGLLLALDPYIDQYKLKDRFLSDQLNWGLHKGKIYGLSNEAEFTGVFFNKSLLDKDGISIPNTMAEALDMCKKAKEKGKVGFSLALNSSMGFFMYNMPLTNIAGKDWIENIIFKEQGRWDSPESIKALDTVYKDMKNAGCFIEDANALNFAGAADHFINEKSYAIAVGTWLVSRIMEMSKTKEIVLAPWFDMGTGKPRLYNMGCGSAWYISAKSKFPDAAAKFLDYSYSDEAVKIWIEEVGIIPPVKQDITKLNVPPIQKVVLEQLYTARGGFSWHIDLFVPLAFNQANRAGQQELFSGKKTSEQLAKELQAQWEARKK